MPRTLPAALETAMDSGIYEPYLRVVLGIDASDTGSVTVEPIKFKLEPLKASVTIERPEIEPSFFRIVRGALINGTPSTISSIWFSVNIFKYNGKLVELSGIPLHYNSSKAIAANATYETVIEEALIQVSAGIEIIPSYEGTAAWKNYQFFPNNKPIILSPVNKIFTILKQKYLILATEDGWDGSQNNMFFFVPSDTRTLDYEITDQLFEYDATAERRQLIWKDETGTVNTLGSGYKTHNLGYLESTDDPPFPTSTVVFFNSHSRSSKLPVHLKYRTGDYVLVNQDDYATPGYMRINVTEILDTNATPAWHQIIEGVQPFANTEGGSIPAPETSSYIPIINNFDGNLDETITNVQRLAEAVDDLPLSSKGVTNGDSHDHSGGDGATINFANLSNKRVFLPFGSYGTLLPLTSAGSPYAVTIDRDMTLISWAQHIYVATTNDSSNYWTITLKRISDNSTLNSMTTQSLSPNTNNLVTDISFSISALTSATLGIYINCTKTGSPGGLYLFCPMMEAEL